MSELTPNDLNNDGLPTELTELQVLKERAKSLGVTHSNNISAEALRAKIQAKQAGEVIPTDETDDAPVEVQPELSGSIPGVNAPHVAADPKLLATLPNTAAFKTAPAPKNARQQLIADANKLVRLRITNLDPKKKDWPGEFITIGNDYIGTVRKYIPYGEKTENGYHVPHCIYEFLRDKKYLYLRTSKNKLHPEMVDKDERWVKEYSLEVLPMLTTAELADLKKAQDASGRVDLKD